MTHTRISDRTLLAHCLARLFGIPHEHQQAMHEDQMISLVERDHWPVPVAEGGSGHFSNVWARLIGEHREKTRKVDVPGIAKRKRIARAEAAHQARMAAKAGEERRAAILLAAVESVGRARPKRPWPKQKIRSRGFQRR